MYNLSGQVSRIINGNSSTARYHYNSFDKVRERIDYLGYAETFQYDEEGNLALHIDRDGRQVQRIYNVFGDSVYEKAVGAEDASGIFVTRGSASATPEDRIDRLALLPNNTAYVESQVELARTQILIEGTVASQPGWAQSAGDGNPRNGGAWQVVTDGGKYNNAIRR